MQADLLFLVDLVVIYSLSLFFMLFTASHVEVLVITTGLCFIFSVVVISAVLLAVEMISENILG